MGFNSAFKGLKLLKTPGTARLNNLNDPVVNVLRDNVERYGRVKQATDYNVIRRMQFGCRLAKARIQAQTNNVQYLLLLTAVRIILWVDNSTKETHCFISMATLNAVYFLYLNLRQQQ